MGLGSANGTRASPSGDTPTKSHGAPSPILSTIASCERVRPGIDAPRVGRHAAMNMGPTDAYFPPLGFDLSTYGFSVHSKNAHVRFHESICSGVSIRSSVFGSTRRL